ncbi:MAG: hypothetical protein A2V81_02245 [Candidatus Abawacabacteria bacterium RBG_16_42_10]|uniref:Transposase IS200-like domain-containing protein n=1 Tax=Candidatus Abawacabacteria bacterium RBG_16_42_10 TaxID=1817814 RepID=A0A1F4XLA0_9BACT|nr:MAG: hypothetical protein A2V81_02245 [Candidatus Abawacabacteria bacterium RBG_16_42_10]
MCKFKGKYRLSSLRLAKWNYSSNGTYFITICTRDRYHYFGEITNDRITLSEMGKLAQNCWENIPQHFPYIKLDEFIIMPNHIHGILIIKKSEFNPQWASNKFGPQSRNLSSIIRGFKSSIQKYATIKKIPFAWQRSFHDHIIQNQKELNNIRRYIINNPIKWSRDRNH